MRTFVRMYVCAAAILAVVPCAGLRASTGRGTAVGPCHATPWACPATHRHVLIGANVSNACTPTPTVRYSRSGAVSSIFNGQTTRIYGMVDGSPAGSLSCGAGAHIFLHHPLHAAVRQKHDSRAVVSPGNAVTRLVAVQPSDDDAHGLDNLHAIRCTRPRQAHVIAGKPPCNLAPSEAAVWCHPRFVLAR